MKPMKFYNRQNELNTLRETERISSEIAQMTVVVGRRRVGKTTLLKMAFNQTPVLYFFVAKKNEILLCEEFVLEIESKLGISWGRFQKFADLFKSLMIVSKEKNFTLIVDEFQEFRSINSAAFSDMQNIWDSNKNESKINLVLCGSIYSLMRNIFENSKEPLFGRATSRLTVKSFDTGTLKEILGDYYPDYKPDDLLAFYMVTGGVAKYIEQLVQKKSFTKEKIINTVFSEGSFFLNEGKDVLIDEFGRDYSNYFSILSLIASSKTERGEIESILGMPVGGYLDKLEKDFNIIRRVRPFGSKEGSRSNKYLIEDNFLNLWFRFIYKFRSAVEISNLAYVRDIAARDYEVYSGIVLEKYFRAKWIESRQFSDIGNYWDKKGGNEIDLVAINEMEERIVFCEIKRNKKKINLTQLQTKSQSFLQIYPQFEASYQALSLDDM